MKILIRKTESISENRAVNTRVKDKDQQTRYKLFFFLFLYFFISSFIAGISSCKTILIRNGLFVVMKIQGLESTLERRKLREVVSSLATSLP